jgi:hypothetical protein
MGYNDRVTLVLGDAELVFEMAITWAGEYGLDAEETQALERLAAKLDRVHVQSLPGWSSSEEERLRSSFRMVWPFRDRVRAIGQ